MSGSEDEPARFNGAIPIHPLVWAILAFIVTFMVGAVALPVGPNEPNAAIHGRIICAAIVLIPCAVLFWPRPKFVREIIVSADGIKATGRRGRTIRIQGEDIRMVSAEAVMSWEERGTYAWGRLYVRSEGQWIAMRFYGGGGSGLYQAIVRRFPQVLGIPGKGDIDLPVINDAAAFSEWVASVRGLARKELRRQIAFNLLNALLLAMFAGTFILGFIASIWQKRAMSWSLGEFMLDIFILGGLGGMIAFLRVAISRLRLLNKVVAQLNEATNTVR